MRLQFKNAHTLHHTFFKRAKDYYHENVGHLKDISEGARLSKEFCNIKALIGDEMSMISPSDLSLINLRMKDAMHDEDLIVCFIELVSSLYH
jgi:hypothetical protein